MTKEKFLTVRWNNILLMAFGIPIVIYAVFALSTDWLSDFVGFIVMAVVGAIY